MDAVLLLQSTVHFFSDVCDVPLYTERRYHIMLTCESSTMKRAKEIVSGVSL